QWSLVSCPPRSLTSRDALEKDGPSMSTRHCTILVALALGCADDKPGAADEGSTGAAESSSTGSATDASASMSMTSQAGDSSSSTGFNPPDGDCGNGFVDEGEECDDGNDVDDDECSNECLTPCGLDWALVHNAPTQDSEIAGRGLATKSDGTIIAVARQ